MGFNVMYIQYIWMKINIVHYQIKNCKQWQIAVA